MGIFVSTVELGRKHLSSFLGVKDWTEEVEDRVQKVIVQFGIDHSGICYEIVAPFGEGNPVDSVLKQRKNILNHVAYLVPNITETVNIFRDQGGIPLDDPKPAAAFDNRNIVFVLLPIGLIVELIEL